MIKGAVCVLSFESTLKVFDRLINKSVSELTNRLLRLSSVTQQDSNMTFDSF